MSSIGSPSSSNSVLFSNWSASCLVLFNSCQGWLSLEKRKETSFELVDCSRLHKEDSLFLLKILHQVGLCSIYWHRQSNLANSFEFQFCIWSTHISRYFLQLLSTHSPSSTFLYLFLKPSLYFLCRHSLHRTSSMNASVEL